MRPKEKTNNWMTNKFQLRCLSKAFFTHGWRRWCSMLRPLLFLSIISCKEVKNTKRINTWKNEKVTKYKIKKYQFIWLCSLIPFPSCVFKWLNDTLSTWFVRSSRLRIFSGIIIFLIHPAIGQRLAFFIGLRITIRALKRWRIGCICPSHCLGQGIVTNTTPPRLGINTSRLKGMRIWPQSICSFRLGLHVYRSLQKKHSDPQKHIPYIKTNPTDNKTKLITFIRINSISRGKDKNQPATPTEIDHDSS